MTAFKIVTLASDGYALRWEQDNAVQELHFESVMAAMRHVKTIPKCEGTNVEFFDERGRRYLTVLL